MVVYYLVALFERDGVVVVDQLIEPERVPELHRAFDALFDGEFETGVRPDEVNWQSEGGDPTLTRPDGLL